jgi:hypothetical protein
MVLERIQDPDWQVQLAALECIKTLCVQGFIFHTFTASCFHHILDDIRTNFISIDGVQKVVQRLLDSDRAVQQAALDCIKSLCVQGITFYNIKALVFHNF